MSVDIDFTHSHPIVTLAVSLLEPDGEEPFTLSDANTTRLRETIHREADAGRLSAEDVQPILRGLVALALLVGKSHRSPLAAHTFLAVAEEVVSRLSTRPEERLAAQAELDAHRANYDSLLGRENKAPDLLSPPPAGVKKWWTLR